MNTRILTTLAIVAATSVAIASAKPNQAQAATITASYDSGYLDVLINGFGSQGLGTFRLTDGEVSTLALCIEADQPHSTTLNAYARVPSSVSSNHLDALIWLIERSPIDDDTAIAAAALAWYYAEALRAPGLPVWADGTNGFAPIGPLAPESWEALTMFSLAHPIGLRAGGSELDLAERRVAELHRQVVAASGPWQLSVDSESHQFVLLGGAGPIVGRPVSIMVTAPGAAPETFETVTGDQGSTDVALADYADGATVRATVSAPGPHREWDGTSAVQRMITATSIELEAEFVVPPLPRHVLVLKHSSDPTIGVADGTFAVLDAAGIEIERSESDDEGHATFDAIDPVSHPAPYTISEVEAPPALVRSVHDVSIGQASTDPLHPTTVEFTNDPMTVPVAVRKQLSVPAAGPADRSEFVFEIIRQQDGWTDWLITGPDGTTESIELALGTYEICELEKPSWADDLVDGGCQAISIDLDDLLAGVVILIPYLNIVPRPDIDTTARDSSDGDQIMSADGGDAIDDVWLTGLTPGSTYTLIGELLSIMPNGITTVVERVVASFTAEFDLAVVPILFEVPPLEPTTLVIVEQLLLGDKVVALHDDLADPDQTLTIAVPKADSSTTTSTPTTLPARVEVVPTTLATGTTPPPLPTIPSPVVTLPRTGNGAATRLLQIGDIGFIAGVALIAITGLLPRHRKRRPTAATT